MLRKLALAGVIVAAVAASAAPGPGFASRSPLTSRTAKLSCAGAASWQRAPSYLGRVAKLKGRVASTKFAAESNGSPTFLDIGRPYPNEGLAIVIWIENRAAFGTPEVRYRHHTICVRGLVSTYNGVPEIIARSPRQIRVIR